MDECRLKSYPYDITHPDMLTFMKLMGDGYMYDKLIKNQPCTDIEEEDDNRMYMGFVKISKCVREIGDPN